MSVYNSLEHALNSLKQPFSLSLSLLCLSPSVPFYGYSSTVVSWSCTRCAWDDVLWFCNEKNSLHDSSPVYCRLAACHLEKLTLGSPGPTEQHCCKIALGDGEVGNGKHKLLDTNEMAQLVCFSSRRGKKQNPGLLAFQKTFI